MLIYMNMCFVFTDIDCVCRFSTQPNRRGARNHSLWRGNFVLSSRSDPIGDRDDVEA